MAGRIPQEFITELVNRTNIIDVMKSHNVALKQVGRGEYKACCPFHGEKTPSFFVSEDKQVYNCFGCGASGNVITFVTEYERLNFVDAIETLAESLGLEVPREHSNSKFNKNDLNTTECYEMMLQCMKLYVSTLHNPQTPQALNYLYNRGISDETIKNFQIGYAPNLWDFVSRFLTQTSSQAAKILVELGMIKSKNDNNKSNEYYDVFRNRVMIPIIDRRGRIIGFGGRVLNDDKPKYLNSPEMMIFHKGSELFGLYQAIQYAKEQHQSTISKLIIVEGYMDVIALNQAGVKNAVASLGTATTTEQFVLMFRNTHHVVCCYDGDAAGQHAAWHALQTVLPILQDNCSISFAFLPVEHDPDSYVREFGASGFDEYIQNAQSMSDYMFSYIKDHIDGKDNKVEIINNTLELLSVMPNNIHLQMLIEKLALTVFQNSDKLMAQWSARSLTKRKPHFNLIEYVKPKFDITPFRRAIILILQYPICVKNNQTIIIKLLNDLSNFKDKIKGFDFICKLVHFILSYNCEGAVSTATIIEAFRETEYEKWVIKLAECELYSRANNIKLENIGADLTSTLTKILLEQNEEIITKLQNESMVRTLSDEEIKFLQERLQFIQNFRGKTKLI